MDATFRVRNQEIKPSAVGVTNDGVIYLSLGSNIDLTLTVAEASKLAIELYDLGFFNLGDKIQRNW